MRTPCGASSGFQWTFFFFHFVCSKALTLPAEVWWLAEPFLPAVAPLVQRGAAAHAASSRGGRNLRTVGSQATRLCTFMCLILAFFLFYTCLVRMRVWCSQLTLVSDLFFFFFLYNTYGFLRLGKRAASHRRCDWALCRISSGRRRRV